MKPTTGTTVTSTTEQPSATQPLPEEQTTSKRGSLAVRAIRLRQGRAWVVAIPELGIVTPPQRRRSAERQAREIAAVAFGEKRGTVHLRVKNSPREQIVQLGDDGHPLSQLFSWLKDEN